MYVKIKDPRTIHSIMYSYHINVRYIYSSSKKESINKKILNIEDRFYKIFTVSRQGY